jgi:hypothetical protein
MGQIDPLLTFRGTKISTSSGRLAIGVISVPGRRFIGFARVVNDEAIGECDKAGRDLDPRDAIAEMIDIRARRKRGIGVHAVGREQVSVTRGMDVELKKHRRLSGDTILLRCPSRHPSNAS